MRFARSVKNPEVHGLTIMWSGRGSYCCIAMLADTIDDCMLLFFNGARAHFDLRQSRTLQYRLLSTIFSGAGPLLKSLLHSLACGAGRLSF